MGDRHLRVEPSTKNRITSTPPLHYSSTKRNDTFHDGGPVRGRYSPLLHSQVSLRTSITSVNTPYSLLSPPSTEHSINSGMGRSKFLVGTDTTCRRSGQRSTKRLSTIHSSPQPSRQITPDVTLDDVRDPTQERPTPLTNLVWSLSWLSVECYTTREDA